MDLYYSDSFVIRFRLAIADLSQYYISYAKRSDQIDPPPYELEDIIPYDFKQETNGEFLVDFISEFIMLYRTIFSKVPLDEDKIDLICADVSEVACYFAGICEFLFRTEKNIRIYFNWETHVINIYGDNDDIVELLKYIGELPKDFNMDLFTDEDFMDI